MLARQVVLLTPPKSSYPSELLSRQQSAPVSALAATLMDLPASVANKGLTAGLSPLDATLTKNKGEGGGSSQIVSIQTRLLRPGRFCGTRTLLFCEFSGRSDRDSTAIAYRRSRPGRNVPTLRS